MGRFGAIAALKNLLIGVAKQIISEFGAISSVSKRFSYKRTCAFRCGSIRYYMRPRAQSKNILQLQH